MFQITHQQKNKVYGFTIVELIIVIAVIGILASITMVGYTAYQNNAKSSQYDTDAMAILKKAEAIASEGVGNNAYPKARSDFPTSDTSAHKLPDSVGVAFTSAPSSSVVNLSEQVTSAPSDGASISRALSLVNSTSQRIYTLKSCGAGAGIVVFYPDPKNGSATNTAVKHLTAGVTTGC